MGALLREALHSMGYRERVAGVWLKPVAFQCFSFHEGKNEWTCWFKSVQGKVERWETKQVHEDVTRFGSYLRQLKEAECWTRTDVYSNVDSEFELEDVPWVEGITDGRVTITPPAV